MVQQRFRQAIQYSKQGKYFYLKIQYSCLHCSIFLRLKFLKYLANGGGNQANIPLNFGSNIYIPTTNSHYSYCKYSYSYYFNQNSVFNIPLFPDHRYTYFHSRASIYAFVSNQFVYMLSNSQYIVFNIFLISARRYLHPWKRKH